MRLLRPLLPALLALPLLAGCTSSDEDPAAPAPLRTPAAGAFDGGPCALVTDDVVDLGRVTEELRGVKDPEQADEDRVLSAQERIAAVAETAPAPVKPALDRLVLRAGLVRIQSDTRMLSDDTLVALREAYDETLDACTAATTGTPGPTDAAVPTDDAVPTDGAGSPATPSAAAPPAPAPSPGAPLGPPAAPAGPTAG